MSFVMIWIDEIPDISSLSAVEVCLKVWPVRGYHWQGTAFERSKTILWCSMEQTHIKPWYNTSKTRYSLRMLEQIRLGWSVVMISDIDSFVLKNRSNHASIIDLSVTFQDTNKSWKSFEEWIKFTEFIYDVFDSIDGNIILVL